MAEVRTKRCSRCKEEKPATDFHKDKSRPDGLRNVCKSCNRDRARKWREENRERHRDNFRKWYEKNRERALERHRKWYEKNRERDLERKRKWLKENPEKARAQVAVRRARKLRATPPWANLEEIQRIYEACPPGCHVDHLYPLKGETVSGLHVPDNLVYLRATDNISKQNKIVSPRAAEIILWMRDKILERHYGRVRSS